ncbi:MAG TPA: hypothetical protein VMR81_07460 [Patescibacteria group bacterium]|nr:hypothetical protein [Patescibacteria group bacterium]
MNKNILIAGLMLAVIVETGYIVMKRNRSQVPTAMVLSAQSKKPPSPSGRPQMLSKGMKLPGSQLAKFAFQVVPGPMSVDAKKATIGFSVNTTMLPDGSTQVDLTPKDSDDQYQRYVVKKGDTLYFIEMTPVDDNAGSDRDINYRDDYGIITDTNGVIQ